MSMSPMYPIVNLSLLHVGVTVTMFVAAYRPAHPLNNLNSHFTLYESSSSIQQLLYLNRRHYIDGWLPYYRCVETEISLL